MSETTLHELDQEMCVLRALKEEYTDIDKKHKECGARKKAQEMKIIEILETNKKETYITEGIGRATVVSKLSVTTPKTNEEKEAFFDWLEANQGRDARIAYMTVNSNSLNSLYKSLNEEAAARGEVLNVDGLSLPTERKTLSFTKQ